VSRIQKRGASISACDIDNITSDANLPFLFNLCCLGLYLSKKILRPVPLSGLAAKKYCRRIPPEIG
jgi:hypothetical protein